MKHNIIETPSLSVAKFVRYDEHNRPMYFDGCEYWTVKSDGKIVSMDEIDE